MVKSLNSLREFRKVLQFRRSIRHFSDKQIDQNLIEEIVRCAATAPSGANKQPWRFVCISNSEIKRKIRVAAEIEEREFYKRRASKEWKKDLMPLETNPDKKFLEDAPWIIVVFRLIKDDDGGNVYYGEESVGIATGLLLAAAQFYGLATLTHTPSPMRFLTEILGRPAYERPYMLIPIGYPAQNSTVPIAALQKKKLSEVLISIT